MDRPRLVHAVDRDAQIQEKADTERWARMAQGFRELLRSEGWDLYRQQLEMVENQHIQQLVAGSKEEHDATRGVILGLRIAFQLPQNIINRVGGA
mgnify:CR=1 FL=1